MIRTRTWRVDVQLFEHDTSTTAEAVLRTGGGVAPVRGRGTAEWHGTGTPVPEICDELAVGRALSDLAQQVLNTASEDIHALGSGAIRVTR